MFLFKSDKTLGAPTRFCGSRMLHNSQAPTARHQDSIGRSLGLPALVGQLKLQTCRHNTRWQASGLLLATLYAPLRFSVFNFSTWEKWGGMSRLGAGLTLGVKPQPLSLFNSRCRSCIWGRLPLVAALNYCLLYLNIPLPFDCVTNKPVKQIR